MFDLSQFEKTPVFAPDNQIGVVLSLSLAEVIEDPTQPRTEFDAEELGKLAEDIGRRGVQAPIAVRPPVDGIYPIIHGARRFRASIMAGLATIPAIVQADEAAFDDYSQVLENTQRDNLTPLDIARFIHKRKALGESNSQIARNLSEKPEWVTYHLALIDMPPEVKQAYESGQIKGAKTVYELRKLVNKEPDLVKEMISSGSEISRARIVEEMKAKKPAPSAALISKEDLDQLQDSSSAPMTLDVTAPPVVVAEQTSSVELTPAKTQKQTPEPAELKRPTVIGIYQGNPVQVLIQLKPSEPGYAWICATGSSGQQEVLADQITLSRIEESYP
jgi:ParB family transcriptional regulator, chromosome partitioning protein